MPCLLNHIVVIRISFIRIYWYGLSMDKILIIIAGIVKRDLTLQNDSDMGGGHN